MVAEVRSTSNQEEGHQQNIEARVALRSIANRIEMSIMGDALRRAQEDSTLAGTALISSQK